MEKVKKTFEKPTVQKVEFDFKTRIAASSCNGGDGWQTGVSYCSLSDY